jgi:hypothetical protein
LQTPYTNCGGALQLKGQYVVRGLHFACCVPRPGFEGQWHFTWIKYGCFVIAGLAFAHLAYPRVQTSNWLVCTREREAMRISQAELYD